MRHCFLCLLTLLLGGCQLTGGDGQGAADKVLQSWAEAYFNYDYEEALELMAPESGKWIHFAASNITEKDVEALQQKAKDASVTILNNHVAETDTLTVATIEVTDFYEHSDLLGEGKIVDKATFHITLVKRDGRWMVRTEGLPQSERQSRD